ncbi:LytTR family DNA-binding domain-containing protein [Rummeliibacillus pycnus]|uniref:LytTR family DNA-binding domain-containing protein n=1 Tax=Rummeliibacillus pycnus TaxID=101070 RepID=UPI0037C9117C
MIQSTEVLAKELAEQYSNLLVDWIPKGASIAIAVGETYIYYEVGAYDILLENGKKFKKGSIADRVINERKKIETVIDQELLGIPYYGIGYPIDFLGKPAALIVILSPNHPEAKRDPFRFITGKQQDQWVPIAIDKISHFESLNKKNWFYADSEQYKINLTLKELARRLPDYFLRIHRSYIINIHAISRITRDFSSNLIIIMKDGNELPVSNSYLNEVKRVLEF